MDWLVDTLREYPSLAVFLTIGIGFYIGSLKFKSFSLGNVTAVLLVGVIVGQLNISIPGPMKDVFFLLFLFAIGYSVGPQFFRALKGDGLKQVFFAVIVCALCLITTWIVAKIMHYGPGEAIGLFAGAQTISAVIGVGSDTMSTLNVTDATRQSWMDIIPVCYAVTYIFGTIGSAYLLANVAPIFLGGINKIKAETAELEKSMNKSSLSADPAYINASRPVVFRAYRCDDSFFDTDHSVADIEKHLADQGRRIFVERIRRAGASSPSSVDSSTMVSRGDEIVLSGRRENIIGDESWIGAEVYDPELLNFPVEQIAVTLTKKRIGKSITVDQLRALKVMYGVSIKKIARGGVDIPVFAQTTLFPGDEVTIVGLQHEVDSAAPALGMPDRPTSSTNMVLVGLGIFIGALIGAITIHIGGIPVSLSTSGGALISGLVCGWLRAKYPKIASIPQPASWLMNNLGLNMFIAVIGISSGPSFISGLKEVGIVLFFMGIVCTSLPLLLGAIIGHKIFKFPAAVNLGCCAGARTTTASLGAIQDAVGSTIPAMGYTVTYAIGNTLLILCGVALVLMTA